MSQRRIAVIGAGITGLTAAYRLQAQGHVVEVFEASDRVGGSIRSIDMGEARVDVGPSGILATRQSVVGLVNDLGLSDQWLEACSDSNRRYIYYQGKLNEVPSSPPGLLLSPWIPLSAKWHILTEMFKGSRTSPPSESLHALIARRFGDFVADVMVDAMVSGVHAAPAKSLEAKAAFPILPQFESAHGSILKGLIHTMKQRKRELPQRAFALKGMLNLRGGLEALPLALQQSLETLHLNTPVHSVTKTADDQWQVKSSVGDLLYTDVVVAISAPQASKCLRETSSELGTLLSEVCYTPLGNVIFYYDSRIETPHGFGYLSPGIEGRPMLGCLFLNRIFPELVPSSCTVLRAFVGGQRAPQDLELDDAALTELATKELEAVLQTSLPPPTSTKVLRWKQSLPFYNQGTTQRWEAIETLVRNLPGLHLGGNWLYGASVADCVSRGDHIAEQITRVS